MALELKFSKSERSSNWGFRVVGGADFQEPLVVVKVHDNSLAEKAGLKVGDIITKINNTETSTLTHSEAHDLLASSGLEFVLEIKRGEFIPAHILEDEGKEIEVRDVQVFVDEDIINKAEELIEVLGKEIFTEFGQHKTTLEKKSEKKMVFSNSTQTYIPTEEKCKLKKFSTFLMKPDRPQVKPKKTIEQKIIEKDPYKVIIEKQSRRRSLPKEKRVQFDQNIIEVEIQSLSSRNEDSPEIISPDPDGRYEHDPDSLEEINFENDYYNECNNQEYVDEYKENDDNESDSLPVKYKPISEIIIDDPNTENTMTLEEQLRAVQKQLEALSLLPSEVQTTLDAVSKQLATIVPNIEEEKEQVSISIEAQAELNTEDEEDSIVGDELDEDSIAEEEVKSIMERAQLEEEEVQENLQEAQENLEEINKIHEEELEEEKRMEEMLIKKEKEMDSKVLKHNYRPIVLPGGRKWIDPDDVVPTRHPKMSDEMIMESIESSLEVISGNRKGINFMKYTPAPKSLDHLQRSEVYRLIHGMEPPTRGITTRAEKVLPEQDYYEASKGTL